MWQTRLWVAIRHPEGTAEHFFCFAHYIPCRDRSRRKFYKVISSHFSHSSEFSRPYVVSMWKRDQVWGAFKTSALHLKTCEWKCRIFIQNWDLSWSLCYTELSIRGLIYWLSRTHFHIFKLLLCRFDDLLPSWAFFMFYFTYLLVY